MTEFFKSVQIEEDKFLDKAKTLKGKDIEFMNKKDPALMGKLFTELFNTEKNFLKIEGIMGETDKKLMV